MIVVENCNASSFRLNLVLGNNVYAHVPDINDFTQGVAALLKLGGVVTFEFTHLMQLIGQNQFELINYQKPLVVIRVSLKKKLK